MTNHPFSLKGIDTGKVGNNKYVNYTLKDFEKDQDVSRAGALELLGNVKLGGLTPIAPTIEQPKTVLGKVAQFLGAGPGFSGETELINGKVVAKERPKGPLNIGRLTSGIADFATFGITDFDQRGNLFGGTHSGSGYGGGQELDYKLPKVIKEQLAEADKPKKVDEGSKNPVDNIEQLYKAQMEYEKAMDPFNRKGRVLDAAIESANMRANMPFITNTMKDLATFKQRQLLDAEKIKQSLPNAVQARLLAGDTGFKAQADAISGQQDAATRFAGLGMRPSNVSFSA